MMSAFASPESSRPTRPPGDSTPRFSANIEMLTNHTRIIGPHPQDAIVADLEDIFGRYQYCHHREVVVREGLSIGQLSIEFLISSDGKISDITISDSLFSERMNNCIGIQTNQLQVSPVPLETTVDTTVFIRLAFSYKVL